MYVTTCRGPRVPGRRALPRSDDSDCRSSEFETFWCGAPRAALASHWLALEHPLPHEGYRADPKRSLLVPFLLSHSAPCPRGWRCEKRGACALAPIHPSPRRHHPMHRRRNLSFSLSLPMPLSSADANARAPHLPNELLFSRVRQGCDMRSQIVPTRFSQRPFCQESRGEGHVRCGYRVDADAHICQWLESP